MVQVLNVRLDVKSTVLRNLRKLDASGVREYIKARGFRPSNHKDDLELAEKLACYEVDAMSTPQLQALL